MRLGTKIYSIDFCISSSSLSLHSSQRLSGISKSKMTKNCRLEIGDWRLSKNKPLFLNMGKSTIYPQKSTINQKSTIYPPKPLSFKQGSIYNLPSAICNPLTSSDGGTIFDEIG